MDGFLPDLEFPKMRMVWIRLGPIYFLARIATINISAMSYVSSPARAGTSVRMRGFGLSIGTAIGRTRPTLWGFGVVPT